MKKTQKYIKAFTLLEILIVVAVLGLLATIIVYTISEARVDANDKHKKIEVKQVNTALEIAKISKSRVPGAQSLGGSIGTLYNENSTKYKTAMQELVNDGYYPEIPISPNGKDYFYGIDQDGNGVFGALLDSKTEIKKNNGCFFSNEDTGCSGDNGKTYKKTYNRNSLKQKADDLEDCEDDNSCNEELGVNEENGGDNNQGGDEEQTTKWSFYGGNNHDWYQAVNYCDNLNENNRSNWRVPEFFESKEAILSGITGFQMGNVSWTTTIIPSSPQDVIGGLYYQSDGVIWGPIFVGKNDGWTGIQTVCVSP